MTPLSDSNLIYAEAYNNRGLAKADLGQSQAAIADYDTAIRLKPDDAEAYYNRGLAKYYLRTIPCCDQQIMILLSDSNLMMPRHTTIGDLRSTDLGQYLAAISDYDTAIRLKPDYAKAYYNRGTTKTLLNRTSEAKQDLQTALKLAEQAGDEDLKVKIKCPSVA